MSRYIGESERALREVFRVARQAAPSILYFDEVESLLPANAGDGVTEKRVIGQFMAEMNGIEDLQGVVVLATTNRLDLVNPSCLTPGRFDLILELPLPNAEARRDIFQIELRRKPVAPGVDLTALAEHTDGMTGADIAFVCRKAALAALRDSVTQGAESILLAAPHFEAALEDLGRR